MSTPPAPTTTTTTAPAAPRLDRRWLFTVIALLLVFGLGYLLGRQLEKQNRYDTYWLLGATLAYFVSGTVFYNLSKRERPGA